MLDALPSSSNTRSRVTATFNTIPASKPEPEPSMRAYRACLHTVTIHLHVERGLECRTVIAITGICTSLQEGFEQYLAHTSYARQDERNAISTPSYTAHPIAELKILRDMRSVDPSKKPAIPRCCCVQDTCQFYFGWGYESNVAHLPNSSDCT